MITRAELKAEMYEYSQKMKQILATPQAYIEKIFGNDSPQETQTEQKIHRFEHRLDIRAKTKTGEKTEDTRFPMEKFADRLGSEGFYYHQRISNRNSLSGTVKRTSTKACVTI